MLGCGPQVGPFPSRPIMGSIRGEGTPQQILAVSWRNKGVISLSSGCSRKDREGVQPPPPPPPHTSVPPPPQRPPPLLAPTTVIFRHHRDAAVLKPSPPPPSPPDRRAAIPSTSTFSGHLPPRAHLLLPSTNPTAVPPPPAPAPQAFPLCVLLHLPRQLCASC